MQRCFLIILVSFFSCGQKENIESEFELLELIIVDSIRVNDDNNYLTGVSQVKLIGDTLIAISSHKIPSLGIVNIQTGELLFKLSEKDLMDISFLPAGFSTLDYPIIKILDKRSNSILIFDIELSSYLGKITLDIPEGKMIRHIQSIFHESKNGFIIELYPEFLDNNDLTFYKESGKVLGFFNRNGVLISSFQDYPKELQDLKSHIAPYRSLSQNYQNDNLWVSFSTSNKISLIDIKNQKDSIDIEIPLSSRFFDFAPQLLNKKINVEFDNYLDYPTTHYFDLIHDGKEKLYISTWMRNNDNLKTFKVSSHLLVFDKTSNKWKETSNPLSTELIGKFVGVVNDTLYFYEGSGRLKDEKYIKRAVLKALEE
ncbi:hypothetical protein [Algoriphagus sp.]|uniref:hypothetical protein n=1 Tax=Algoriphagus sp. TaxID=1872435 RepID=UPI0032971EB3